MVKKSCVGVLMTGLFFFGAISFVKAADEVKGAEVVAPESKPVNNCTWSNLKFAQFLGNKFGISLGENELDMSDADKYAALTSALSQKGVTYFSTVKAEEPVQCCGAADTLYAVVGAKEPLGSCDLKINYLIQNGLLKLPAPGSDPCGALCSIEEVFGAPVIVEKFTAPRTPPDTNPPGETPENPSSHT